MTIDLQHFGYGAGVVMVGFLAGMVCNYLFAAIRGMTKI